MLLGHKIEIRKAECYSAVLPVTLPMARQELQKKTPSNSEGVFSVIAKFSINQQRVVQSWRLPSGLAATHPPA